MSNYGQASRQVELDGIAKLNLHFGKSAKIVDLGETSGHDFEILYAGGRRAIGEFSWLTEPDSQAMWNAILKREEPQQIQLAVGLGLWTITLNKTININRLEQLAATWIGEVCATGKDHIEIYEGWPNTELARTLRANGISRINKFSDENDIAFFFVMGDSGVVPPDLIPLRDTIQVLLETNETVRSNCLKLIELDSNEKHVYLRLGDLVPNLQTWALANEREPVEIPELEFPDEISHIWLESGSVQSRNILWERGMKPKYF